MNKQKLTIGLVALALLVGVGWGLANYPWEDPELAELEQLRETSFQNRENMSEEQRREAWGQMRDKIEKLPEEKRREFFESGQPMFQRMINERLDTFFALSKEEQNAELDKRIDREENRSSNGGGEGRGRRGGPGRGDWGNMSQKERDKRRQERLDRTTPELRAKFDKYRDMLNARRKERGLPPSSGRGGWR